MIRLQFTPPDSDAAWDAWIQDCRAAAVTMLANVTGKPKIDAALYKRQRDRLLALLGVPNSDVDLGFQAAFPRRALSM
jgi:hypothetical protein